MINLNSIPKQNPNVAGQVVDDEAVLVSPEKGKVQVLNQIGAVIWNLADGQNTVAAIVAEVCRHYDADQEQVESDALEFLTVMLEKGIIQVEG